MKNYFFIARFVTFTFFVKTAILGCLIILCFSAGTTIGFAAPGDLDTSFNPNNVVPAGATVQKMTVQPDGKVLVSVAANNQISLLRLNQDGSLDNAFNAAGIVPNPGRLHDIALQSDGKILVSTNTSGGPIDPKLTRLNPNGSIDNSFTISGANDDIRDIAVQADGKILVSGNFTSYQGDFTRVRIARLNPNGSIDTSFSAGPITPAGFGVNKVAIQTDGKIIIGGDFSSINGTERRRIARLNTDGSLDTSFNPGTGISGGGNGLIQSIAFQSNGKIVIGGDFANYNGTLRRGVARINTDGSLDTTFNPGLSSNAFQISSVVVQPDGKIIIGSDNAFVSRLNSSDGSNDNSFVVTVNAPITGVALQTNGKIMISGNFMTVNGSPRNSIARLLGDAVVSRPAPFDFDGDGKTDISIYRPSVGQWWYQNSSNSTVTAFQFGTSTDKIVPADYDGDGKTDAAFFRPSTGEWFVLRSSNFTFFAAPFGISTDIPAPGDFDGDGIADLTVYRPSIATWFILKTTGGVQITSFGTNGDIPVVGDYDNDGKADIAIFRPVGGSGNAEWWISRSMAGLFAVPFGSSTDKPVAGDYTGDGKSDCAFWRVSTGEWFVLRSEDLSFFAAPFGTSGDVPVPGDYDGDGKNDLAVFRPTGSTWFVSKSTGGVFIQGFGTTGDKPVPSAYVP